MLGEGKRNLTRKILGGSCTYVRNTWKEQFWIDKVKKEWRELTCPEKKKRGNRNDGTKTDYGTEVRTCWASTYSKACDPKVSVTIRRGLKERLGPGGVRTAR